MCSQPPKAINDSWIVDEILEAIPMIDPETEELGFTGGEPTLLGDRLIEVLKSCKQNLPNTSIHVLSNGRKFSDLGFTQAWAKIDHPDLMVGIPTIRTFQRSTITLFKQTAHLTKRSAVF